MSLRLLEKRGSRSLAAQRFGSADDASAAPDGSDEQLLARHLFGDGRAFELLVKRYRADLLAFLGRLMGDTTAAEDVAQETFLRLHRSAEKFESSKGLRPWLFSIAANAVRDYYRYHARRPATSLHAPRGPAILRVRRWRRCIPRPPKPRTAASNAPRPNSASAARWIACQSTCGKSFS